MKFNGHKIKFVVRATAITLFVFVSAFLFAQKVTVQVSSSKVQVGVPFQIAFAVNATPSTYTPPNFKDFDIYSGPKSEPKHAICEWQYVAVIFNFIFNCGEERREVNNSPIERDVSERTKCSKQSINH